MMNLSTAATGSYKLILAAFLACGLIFNAPARAHEKDAAVAIPNTPAAIWKSIDSETDEMSKVIKAGTLEDLHHHAFAVRDLVAALPEHSASLPADKLAKVKSGEKFVSTLATRLDASGDAKDKAASEENLKKLEDVLVTIRANYSEISPSGADVKEAPASPTATVEKK